MSPDVTRMVSDLCVGCGLCCSGELFDQARLRPGEAAVWRDQGFTIVQTRDNEGSIADTFVEPCKHLNGTACARYSMERPAVCSSFFCTLAMALAKGKTSAADAKAIVDQANAKFATLRAFLKPGENWPAARARWRSLQAVPTNDPEDARFRVEMAAMNLWLNRHFRARSGKDQLTFW